MQRLPDTKKLLAEIKEKEEEERIAKEIAACDDYPYHRALHMILPYQHRRSVKVRLNKMELDTLVFFVFYRRQNIRELYLIDNKIVDIDILNYF